MLLIPQIPAFNDTAYTYEAAPLALHLLKYYSKWFNSIYDASQPVETWTKQTLAEVKIQFQNLEIDFVHADMKKALIAWLGVRNIPYIPKGKHKRSPQYYWIPPLYGNDTQSE